MLTEEQRAHYINMFKTGNAEVVFFNMENFSDKFSRGAEGWEFYKECAALVRDHGPEHFEEFKKRFGHLPNKDAMITSEFGSHEKAAAAMLKAFQDETADLKAKIEAEKKPGFFGRLFGK